MLEEDEKDKAEVENDEERQVEESVGVLVEELGGVLEHVALELDFV